MFLEKWFALVALTTLTACNNCGDSKPAAPGEPAEATSGSRPFHTSWDGGRRHLRLRGHDLGSAVPHDADGGALHPPPPPQ
jgi:hypothetical protein